MFLSGYKQFALLYSGLFVCSYTLMAGWADPISSQTGGQTEHKGLRKQATFSILSCITWWSHDAVGYHPAMFLLLENKCGHDISGDEIPFQGRFTDLRDGYVTVAREFKRTPVRKHERFLLLLRGPKSFELPIDSAVWPVMECKAMCRWKNDKGDSDGAVENLFETHLARVTMTDEEAQGQLIAQAGSNLRFAKQERLQIQPGDESSNESVLPSQPISLKALPGSMPPAASPVNKQAKEHKKEPAAPLAVAKKNKIKFYRRLPKHLPGLGQDFYAFEQFYGHALQFQSANGKDDLTWTHYPARDPFMDIYAGSRNASKVDIVIITASVSTNPKESDLLTMVRLLTGCPSNTSIVPFVHSVRYLPSGRSEIMTTVTRDDRVLAFKIPDANGQTDKVVVLAVSRLPGDLESAVDNCSKRVDFLRRLSTVD